MLEELTENMKKFLTFGLIAVASAYYASLPFVTAEAGGNPAMPPDMQVSLAATSTVVSVLAMRITAYASVPDETSDHPFITADGSHVYDGEVASNILPFGTKIEIPALFGDKVFTVHDRMSHHIKNTIDIWMPTVKKAIYFGAQHASVLVLGNETSTVALNSR